MLIEKTSYEVGDVVTIKFVGGDEVIAKLTFKGTEAITVTRPLLVIMSQEGFGLMPYVLTSSPELQYQFDMKNIISLTKTLKEVTNEYIKQTTGLTVH